MNIIKFTLPQGSPQQPPIQYVHPYDYKEIESLITSLCENAIISPHQEAALNQILGSLIQTKLPSIGNVRINEEPPPAFVFIDPNTIHTHRMNRVQKAVAQVLQIEEPSLIFIWAEKEVTETRKRAEETRLECSKLCMNKQFQEARILADTIPHRGMRSKALLAITFKIMSDSLTEELISFAISTAYTIPDLYTQVQALMNCIEPLMLKDQEERAFEIAKKAIESANNISGDKCNDAFNVINDTLGQFPYLESRFSSEEAP